ncbi:hypothetical protein VTJ04DRAFT_10935 [Mycothermus thermophilus]|uniref:uncharacterized protein n=1 Tax=Humicola insolens TaxID=85995 RepID=UPI00374334BF
MVSTTTAKSPKYGNRLFVDIVDQRAQNEPDRVWVYIPVSSNPAGGWKEITYKQAANAVNRVAHKLVHLTGKPNPGEFPTVAYIGPNDVRYLVFTLGAVKAGYKALFVSPRNSLEGQLNLFEQTDCHAVWFEAMYRDTVQSWLQERDMHAVMTFPVSAWFPEEELEPFPYEKSFEEAEWDPLVVLHSSGTTGLPKPIVVRQGMLAIGDKFHDLGDWKGHRIWLEELARRGKSIMVPMPMYHAAGLYVSLAMIHYWDVPVVLGISGRPLTADLAVDCLKYSGADATLLPPSILEEMSTSNDAIAALKRLGWVGFGGGNLATEAGDRLVSKGVTLVNMISTTEFAPYPVYWQPDPKLWQWFIYNPDLFGCEWRPSGDQDTYEMVIKRKGKEPGFQGIFYTFPNAQEYNTKDLYRPHPSLPDHWIYAGRSDSIIVFSNGEKLNPVSIEDTMMSHPLVKGAIVVGTNHFQPALILEPVEYPKDDEETAKFIDRVWPTVVKANQETPAHGQIGRQYITLARPDKPFLRSGKGTIQRAVTIRMYKDEIEQIYSQTKQVASSEAPPLDLSSKASLTASVMTLFERWLHAPELEPDTDFFTVGIDSLQVITASRLLRAGLEAAGVVVDASALATRVIYGHPTARRLAEYLYAVVNKEGQDATASGEQSPREEDHAMEALLQKYTRDLPPARGNKPPPADEDQVIVITGTTGQLGSYLLHFACTSPRVKKVICLNRTADAEARQRKAHADRGLTADLSKAEFLHADLSRHDLGLGGVTYERLGREVDRIIHNQWPVNFNMPVESFEPHIRGVRNLVDFSVGAARRVPVVFVSSIATVDRWRRPEPVPEASLHDLGIATGGYGRSKLVSSLILERANEVSGVPVEVIRVGQIGGPASEKGRWNRQEWLPSLVASSVYLGILPNNIGQMTTVDWTPIEGIAKMVLEVSGVTSHVPVEEISGYFHGINPRTTQWETLAQAVMEFYGGRIRRLVSFDEWVKALEQSQSETEDVNVNPALKLLDSYKAWAKAAQEGQGYVAMETSRTTSRSETMGEMQAVTPELMKNWCRQWAF